MSKGITKKKYVFPSGRIVYIQGYENYALDYYLTIYDEDDIIVGDATKIPVIKYRFENEEHTYFPDIYMPKDTLLVEVKSTYTYEKDKDKNLAKQCACKNLGYNFTFFIKGKER